MKEFLGNDFLLTTESSKKLYHEYAEKMPIIDYHCHLDAREIFEDKHFSNITELWLGGDHYKWRQMRSNGVEEAYITGDAPDKEKFYKWAETLEMSIGNPLYHWSHLELQRYFNYKGILNGDTAESVWNWCNEIIKGHDFSARSLIKKSKVTHICTTDDPIDSLEWHKKIAADDSFDVAVLPAWRPDKAMDVDKPNYSDYIAELSRVSGIQILSYLDLQKALKIRMEYFNNNGCKISDHGLYYIMYNPAPADEVERIFTKGVYGEKVTEEEADKFRTAFMLFAAREYHKLGWTMQLHYGCKRDNNTFYFNKIGAATGFDCINNNTSSAQLADFLNALSITDQLPKTIIYSLNPNDNQYIGTIIGCFQDSSIAGKVQHGSAWWFNDNKTGMIEQMTSLANLGVLGNFIGMLTDSRSFLSFTRHEYFRRILCELVGGWVDNGEYPDDEKALKKIIEGICYYNAKKYFGF